MREETRRLRRAVAAMGMLAACAGDLTAQGSGAPADSGGHWPRPICFNANRHYSCRTFVLAEFGAAKMLTTTHVAGTTSEDFHNAVEADVGLMWNVGGRRALGGAVLLSDAPEGLEIRYRRWLGDDRSALDVSLGLVSGPVWVHDAVSSPAFASERHVGATAAVMLWDIPSLAVYTRASLLRDSRGRARTAAWVGARTGGGLAVTLGVLYHVLNGMFEGW